MDRKIITKMPPKYQYFDNVTKECKQVMKKVILKKYVSRDTKEGLKQVTAANTMYFYSLTSLWYVSRQQSGSFYSKTNPKSTWRITLYQHLLSCDNWFWSTGNTTDKYQCALFSSYSSSWSRTVEVHCIGCRNLFQSFLWHLYLTLVLFFLRTSFII